LRFSGNLLGSTQVTQSDSDSVTVSVRGSTPYRKGILNQNIDPWFGISPDNETDILQDVQRVFSDNVRKANGG
jgi:hypothetical protein